MSRFGTMNNDKKQKINTSRCWDTFFEKSRGPRAEWVLKCWNQSFSGNDERVANASTCSNIYTNGITRSDEEWCWWLTVAQIQSFLHARTLPVPILALIAHFWNIININRLTQRASLLLSSKILADNHQHGNCHNRERECRQYRSSDDCITYQCLIALALPHNYACHYRLVHLYGKQKLSEVWSYDLKFPIPTFYLIFLEFGFTFEEVFQPCFNRLLLWRQRCKIILQISPPHSVGLQVLPSFTRHDTLSIKLKALNPRRKTLNTGLILQVKHIYIMAFLCRGFPYLLLSFKYVKDFTILQKVDLKSYQ